MKLKKIIFIAIIGLIGIFAAACAAKMNAGVVPVNKSADGLAIKGFDAVAYYTIGAATEGKPEYEFAWKGAKWLFSSRENLEKFQQKPEEFAPEFGGYCSYAVAHGYTAEGDPNAWKIVDGKLYLNYSPKVKEMWEKDESQFIAVGERNWQEFQTKTPEHKGN